MLSLNRAYTRLRVMLDEIESYIENSGKLGYAADEIADIENWKQEDLNKKTHEMNKKKTGDYFLDMTDGKMREDFVERFIRLENRKGLLRFIHPEQRARPTEPLAQLCKGDEERTQRDTTCEKLEGVDALDKGIVTTWTTRAVPAYPKPVKDKGTYRGWDP